MRTGTDNRDVRLQVLGEDPKEQNKVLVSIENAWGVTGDQLAELTVQQIKEGGSVELERDCVTGRNHRRR